MKNKLLYDGFVKITEIDYKGKKYERVDLQNAVSGLVVHEAGRILLVRQYRPALRSSTWEIRAGIRDKPHLSAKEAF